MSYPYPLLSSSSLIALSLILLFSALLFARIIVIIRINFILLVLLFLLLLLFKRNLEVKFSTIWTDEKQRWAEVGRRDEQKRED